MINLGTLKEITDLRSVWPHEALNFTPWVAENVDLLADAVGLDITVDETESSVGDFNVDIYASETGTDRKIIIENQLEDTDHDHLGKLITYASGKDADVVIWVVKHAREEHKAAVEWLNNHTDDKIGFFLCEIKLFQIGDSDIAPSFTVVERPNDWTKEIKKTSSSRNYDVLGRELFTPDEVRKLDNKKCIIFIRGFDPIMDNKFIPFNHPMFNQTADGKGEPYVHQIRGADNLIGPPFEILSDKAVKYYEKLKDKGENVYIDSLTYEQFMMLGDAELSRRFSMQDEAEQKAKIDREQANELEYVDESQKSDAAESANTSNGSAGAKPVRNPEREKPKWEDTITNRMLHWSYTPEQKEEVKKALAAGVPKATILTYFYPEVTVERMSSYRKKQ